MGRKLVDLTGRRFGQLLVTKLVGPRRWLCRCDCGRQVIRRADVLQNQRTKIAHRQSCGQGPCKQDSNLKGKVFGKWTVVRLAGKDKWGQLTWWCRCSCGKRKVVHGGVLRRGYSKSCGCLRKARKLRASRAPGTGKVSIASLNSFVILRRLLAGEQQSAVARDTGVSRQRVNHVVSRARKAGFEISPQSLGLHKMTAICPTCLRLVSLRAHRGFKPADCRFPTRH